MPNWVYHTVDSYSKDIHDKYKGEETDIDFNKIIPEPEEIKYTISGSMNRTGKDLYDYQKYKEEVGDYKSSNKYHCNLYKDLRNRAETGLINIGNAAVENPDMSLNQMVNENERLADTYKHYTELFGNRAFCHLSNEEFYTSCDKYRDSLNQTFLKDKERSPEYYKGDSIEDYGKHCYELKEKYGFDNWYDWRVANWGTKWNASDTDYDENQQVLHFNTPWDVPYPILAKIAEDNSDAKPMDVYSEEETGWFVKSQMKEGKLYELSTGEYNWSEDSDEPVMTENVYDEPKVATFTQVREESIKEWAKFVDSLH